MVDVRQVRPDEWELMKAIRLHALSDSPEAFCTTHDEAALFADDVWIERASTDPEKDESTTFLAFDGTDAVGLAVGVLRDDSDLDVVSVFVEPGHRGMGIAGELMAMVEAWARRRGAVHAFLDVEFGNAPARGFYERLGYLPTGKQEPYPVRDWLRKVELSKSLELV